KRTGGKNDWQEGGDLWGDDLIEQASDQHQAGEMKAEEPLFILHTPGSIGKAKGVLHTTGGCFGGVGGGLLYFFFFF
ncbi:acetyl-coenzyme A synthetase, partial [Escherichia coli]|nr:acetyl-coenzyme A synthetase [Escherichia coli]